jgi:hypothetical protein
VGRGKLSTEGIKLKAQAANGGKKHRGGKIANLEKQCRWIHRQNLEQHRSTEIRTSLGGGVRWIDGEIEGGGSVVAGQDSRDAKQNEGY